METRRERARPMSPEERREAIIRAARPLVIEHGRATTTKLIAEAAGIAEGTIFRAFASKDELFEAVIEAEFDPAPFLDTLGRVDRSLPLEERLLVLGELMQRRFLGIFQLMVALALPRPPQRQHDAQHLAWRQEVLDRMVEILEPDADAFRVPLPDVVRLLRLLTFSGSHPHISDQRPLAAEQIVDVILHGTLKKDS